MIIKINEGAPLLIKEQVLKWQHKGWVTIIDDSVNEDSQEQTIDVEDRTGDDDDTIDIVQEWVNQLKAIAGQIDKTLNKQIIDTRARGLPGAYAFKFNAKGFCSMLDELIEYHYSHISSYLHETRKPRGVSFVCPFLGEILKAHLFNTEKLQKCDLKDVLSRFYTNPDTAVKKLSIHSELCRNEDAALLVEIAKTIGKKYAKG